MANTYPKILIVDDNDIMRALLRGLLRDQEFHVIGEAKTGVGALELVERLQPDIVCMDVVMPEMDGLEALNEIRRTHPDVAVVMVTGNASPENVREAIQNGASGFIVKPFNAARVLDTLKHVWKQAQARRTGG